MKHQKNCESQERVALFTISWQGRSSMVTDELVTEVKAILHNLRVSGGGISRKTVIAMGNRLLSSRYPEKFTKNHERVTLLTQWALGILK